MEAIMENDDIRVAILAELQLIRRAARAILFVLMCGIALVVFAISPPLGVAAAVFVGIVTVAALIGAILGISTGKLINRMRDK